MSDEAEVEQTAQEEPDWRLTWRLARQQAAYLATTVALVALVALVLGVVAVALQAGRDETRNSDMAFIMAPAVPPRSLADHSFELYRRSYVPTLVIIGEGQASLSASLIERGLPEAQLIGAADDLPRLAQEARANGATSVLLVAPPADLLRAIKIVRDHGLRAYGSPIPGARVEPLSLLGASIDYWRYVLLGL